QPVAPIFSTSAATLPQIVNYEGPGFGGSTVTSMSPPGLSVPDGTVPATPPPVESRAAPAAPNGDAVVAPAADVADAIPLDAVRLASDLVEGAGGVINGNHEGQGFALAALALTLAVERGWERAARRQLAKRADRNRSTDDSDGRRFRPTAKNIDA